VDVWFSLEPDGSVHEVGLRSSSGDRDLDRAAIEVARRSRFKLASAGGPETARGYIAYQFRLSR
jgi:TonB family protein